MIGDKVAIRYTHIAGKKLLWIYFKPNHYAHQIRVFFGHIIFMIPQYTKGGRA